MRKCGGEGENEWPPGRREQDEGGTAQLLHATPEPKSVTRKDPTPRSIAKSPRSDPTWPPDNAGTTRTADSTSVSCGTARLLPFAQAHPPSATPLAPFVVATNTHNKASYIHADVFRGRALHPFRRPIDSIRLAGMQYTGSRSSSPG